MIVEICAPTLQSAIYANKAGADRIELCQNLGEGGTTPSWATIRYCTEKLQLKTNVLIRPRGGDFCYNDNEFEVIKEEIQACQKLGVNGIVIGFLHPDLTIDTNKLCEAISIAKGLEITFHRAFDLCKEQEEGLEKLIDCGCHRVLTSGFCINAWEGRENLKRLVRRAENRIEILAGCGITAENVASIITTTRVREIHSSCKSIIQKKENFVLEQDLDLSNWQYEESSEAKIQQLLINAKSIPS